MTFPVFLLACAAGWFAVAWWLEARAHERAVRAFWTLDKLLCSALDALDQANARRSHEVVEHVSWYTPPALTADEALRDWTHGDAA